jgi:hypothetical protein
LTVLGVFLVGASIALAVSGLQNPSFESGLNGWEVHTERGNDSTRQIVYGAGGTKGRPVPCDRKPYGICVVGTDTFQYFDGHGGQIATQTVSPVVGSKMLRLGGPFGGANVRQVRDRFVVQQQLTVDPSNRILQLYYNVFSYDRYNDRLEFRATVTNEDGAVIASQKRGSSGRYGRLTNSGWVPTSIDLSAYSGQQVNLRITSGGTRDEYAPFWAYVDAALAPTVVTPPATTPKGENRDSQPPDTSITNSPRKALKAKGKKKAKAKFAFASTEANSRFECLVDKGAWKACAASTTVAAGKGKHTLQVRAIDAAGNTDPSPASAGFKVKAAKGKKK